MMDQLDTPRCMHQAVGSSAGVVWHLYRHGNVAKVLSNNLILLYLEYSVMDS